MATAFMKWLETSPKDYERGIQLLTLGRLRIVWQQIAAHVQQGMRILEIGCGTGELTVMLAKAGGVVAGIDTSPDMLAEAMHKIKAQGVIEQVKLKYLDATQIEDAFPIASFDLIVGSLVFSEMPPDEQSYVLKACLPLLTPNGRLMVADEVVPAGSLSRFIYYLIRLPIGLVTWLFTRTTTHPLRNLDENLAQAGFHAHKLVAYLGGSLVLFEATLPESNGRASQVPSYPRLSHRVTVHTILLDIWELFFRILPPYPKIQPGLYRVGDPGSSSPVLVTGNFDLTVRRLVRAIDGKLDAWILVADTAGINVWCGAGGGYFTAEKVIASLKFTHLEQVVNHRVLILPQLCANGVDGWRVREGTGWDVKWGPIRACDISAYLDAGSHKDERMRCVNFPLKDRLEMVTVTLGFYALMILIPVYLFWRGLFWPLTVSLLGLSYFYAVFHPWLPGRDGLAKSLPLNLIAVAGLLAYVVGIEPLPTVQLFNWIIGLTALSVFTAGEMQGMSPVMRGEQANWGWEAIIGAILVLIYWLVPRMLGWR